MPTVPVAVVLIAVLLMAVTDVWKFKVQNVLTLPLLASGLIYHGIVGGPTEFLGSVLGAAFGFGVLLVFYLMGGVGAGDVKLLAGVGAWLQLPLTFCVFVVSSLAAGAYAVVLLLKYRQVSETWVNLQIVWYRLKTIGRALASEDNIEAAVTRADRRQRVIPFAAMVALGLFALLAMALLARLS
jgi:prepilin peptidase CpaA